MQFVVNLCVYFVFSFLSFIVADPDYYNVRENLGKTMGDIGFYSELYILFQATWTGVVIDTFGRKIPTVVGFVIAGLAIIAIPHFHDIYPTFLILRTLIVAGTIVALNLPLLPDYVSQ